MKHLSEVTIEYGSNYQSHGRSEKPSIGNEDAVLLKRAEHVAPARRRLVDTQAKKGERHLGGNILRNQQCCLGQQQAKCLGQDVAFQEVEICSTEATRRQNVVPAARAQNHTPYQAGWTGPSDQADYAG